MRTGHILCAALLVLGGVDAASAQAPPAVERPAGRGAETADIRPAELANALDRYALVQAQRMLQLDDTHYLQFMPRLKNLQATRRRNTIARARLVQNLRRLVGARAQGEPDDKAILDVLTSLRDHDERALRELQAAYDAVDEALTVRQRARFRLFEENIENRKLELLMKARSRPPGGG